MKKILVVGSVGQIGSEIVPKLRKRYGSTNVIAAGHLTQPEASLEASGPFEYLDVTNFERLTEVVYDYKIDTIYNLAALLSAKAEDNPHDAWDIGINGLKNVLDVAVMSKCSVFTPSSIGAFGSSTPLDNTPQVTIQRPGTIYGITKVAGELLCDYYNNKYGIDTRGLRLPGIISSKAKLGGGTTDYAVEIFHAAIRDKQYTCPLRKDTYLDMMFMPDCTDAMIKIMEADPKGLRHRNAYNVTAMSFTPEMLANEIKKHIPEFKMYYKIDILRQSIASSWPNKMNDLYARTDWDFNPKYDLSKMVKSMLDTLKGKTK